MTEGKPLYVGERKKPSNMWDMRSMREAMEDPEYEKRKSRISGLSNAEKAEMDRINSEREMG